MKTRLLIKKTAAALLVSAVMVSSSTLTGISVSAAGAEVDTAEALQTAIKNAELNPTKLTLTADIIADASIVIDTAQDITIDLDGHTLGRSLSGSETNGSVITVEGGTLTLNDSSLEQTGCITGGAASNFGGGIYCVKKDKVPSTLILSGITLKANKAGSGGALYVDSGSTATAENCIFEGNSAERGGAVTGIGTVTLSSCTFRDNKADYYGGGVYAAASAKNVVTIQNSSVFSGNSSGTDGGALYADSGNLVVTSVSFTDNQAVSSGGAVGTGASVSAEFTKATFSGNKCLESGGSVLNAGTLLLKKCNISGSNARYGGGVYNTGKLTVTDSQIIENDCTENGGGIYMSDGTFALGGGLTKVKGNTKNADENNANDVSFASFSKITVTGKFDRGSRIGLNLSNMQADLTKGYGTSNKLSANNYFFINDDEYRISPDSKKTEVYMEKDPNVVKNTSKSIVEIYSDGKRISKNEYDSPASAWLAAYNTADNKKKTILTFGGDWITDKMLQLDKDKRITLDLNGHFINRNMDHEMDDAGGVFRLDGKSILTIRDSNPDSVGFDGIKGGVLTGGASSDTGGCFEIVGSSEVILEGGTIYDCITDKDGGAVRAVHGDFTMTGGRIYSCQTIDSTDSCQGGAIYVDDDGTLTLSDCMIDDCYSEDSGGAIYAENAEIYLSNVTFSGNTCRDYGGAICLWDDTLLHARNCLFTGNEAEDDGGAVYVDDAPDDDGIILFESCKFRRNKAGVDGGAIYVCDDRVGLSNTEITNNYAKKRGGAIFVDCRYNFTVRGLMTIKDNQCDNSSMANLTLEYGNFTDAKLMNSGLYKGSIIRIGTTNSSGETELTHKHTEFNEYQMRYFEADEGTLTFKKIGNKFIGMATSASIFGNGSMEIIACFGTFWLVLAVVVIAAKKEKNKKAAALKAQKAYITDEGGEEDDQN